MKLQIKIGNVPWKQVVYFAREDVDAMKTTAHNLGAMGERGEGEGVRLRILDDYDETHATWSWNTGWVPGPKAQAAAQAAEVQA